ELAFLGGTGVAPVMKTHLERDLDRRGAVRAVEAMTELAGRQRRQALGKLDHRPVREPGQHRMLEIGKLRGDRAADRRMRVTEEVHPPGADGVQITPPLEVVQPGSAAASDRHQRQALVLLHLRAWMPDGGTAPRDPVTIW